VYAEYTVDEQLEADHDDLAPEVQEQIDGAEYHGETAGEQPRDHPPARPVPRLGDRG
jgi:hypothetical protein